eukprot:m.104470 g.104470  ORF g.104470 m.104470 type:complete len:91 (-) comp15246_c0_seq3:922-1194(-)
MLCLPSRLGNQAREVVERGIMMSCIVAGWTLGAVLSEATFENGRRPPFQASKSAVVAGATLGGLALLAGCVLLLLAYVARRRTEYQNLPS